MISLPIYIKGKVSIKSMPGDNITIENLSNYLADSLQQEEAKSVDIEQNQIRFQVGWFRPLWNWKILVPISTGIISLKEESDAISVNYKLSFEKISIVATVIALIAFMSGLNKIEMMDNIVIIVMLWLWLVGGNIIITAIRFPRFLKTCAAELEKRIYYWDKK